MSLTDLTEKISYVSQDNFLFNMSLRDNIRIGKPEATDKEVEWAAAQAGCDEFISRFPQGYDTNAGDAGARLSGGERQRLAIARAILKNAPIVILDEATAFTDPEKGEVTKANTKNVLEGRCAPVRRWIYNWWESSLVRPSKSPVPSPWNAKG